MKPEKTPSAGPAAVRGSADPQTELPGETSQRVILVGIYTSDEKDCVESLDELEALARTAGAVCAGRLMQKMTGEGGHPGFYIGSGKTEELRDLVEWEEADAVICDDELTPVQMRNLQNELEVEVLDRTLLILDIFAGRARTSEGKLQVELAQLSYRLSHLTGMGKMLSRQGGGIGTRGPGEKKLETDRRRIRERITRLKKELEEVRRHRTLLRSHRREGLMPTAALVGYTNSGKSTLLNRLTHAGAYAADQLFATLDPLTRVLTLPDGAQVLLTDTVGFIRKLPHTLIRAFRSTLEEALYADSLIHVVDVSSPMMEKQMYVVYQTLRELGVTGKPVITLFNKADRTEGTRPSLRDPQSDAAILCSARTGEGLDSFLDTLGKILDNRMIRIERVYAYKDAGKEALIRRCGRILDLEYTGDGIRITALVPPEIYGQV